MKSNKKRSRSTVAAALLLGMLTGGTSGGTGTVQKRSIDNISSNLNLAEKLYVIDEANLGGRAVWVMIASLQGIVAQDKSAIYIRFNQPTYIKWLESVQKDSKILIEEVRDPWVLVEKFKEKINQKGYVRYKANTPSINVACTVAGVERYLVVEEELAETAKVHGLYEALDVRNKDEYWAFEHYKDKLNDKVVFSQRPDNPALRDYGIAEKSLFYYEMPKSKLTNILKWLRPNAPVFGWYSDEVSGVSLSSKHGKTTIASDHANNLTVFAALPKDDLKQKAYKPNKEEKTNVHYVTFIMSDGDNIQWYVNNQPLDEKYYGYQGRGTFAMGWSISPSLAELAPNVMKYCYDTETDNDNFVAAVSGFSYIYPSNYPEKNLKEFVKLTGDYMRKSDLQYIQILDHKLNKKVIEAYADDPQIKGGFYMYGDRYAGGKGALYWQNGKPFITFRESLWNDNPAKMAARINSYVKNTKAVEGYTAINVHPWSHSMQDVATIVALLGKEVKVVTPQEFLELIKANVKQADVTK